MLRQVLVLLLLSLLASCSSVRRDGPPDYDVDVSHIQNPVPKPEPLAKYGNMSSYRVYGKRYYVLKSPQHFEETGIASWYGSKFDRHRTSSGERYSMLAMTAAHKTLPLPTYVEVTNLKNNRKIIVKVNDRGPFASNRIIDLSYVAAKKIGMLGHGTTYVRIKALDPYTYARRDTRPAARPVAHASPVLATNARASVYLQAGAFSNKSNAISFKKRLANLQAYPVRVATPGQKSKLYRVQIGPIRDKASAEQLSRKLKSIGIAAKKIQEV